MQSRQSGVWPGLAGLVTACVLLLTAVEGQREEDLLPIQFNLATRARISVNATCGHKREREVFCKLVEHVRIFPAENRQCDICDARSENPALRHPISNAVDGSQRWWQSPTLANGPEYNYVTITLDLQQVYQIAYIIMKAANAPRPGNWILERSIDGETYLPWQYFAIDDQECRTAYGLDATIGLPVFVRDDQVICTTRYSAIEPLDGGEIFVSLINERPGAYRPSKTLLEFTSARYIRMRFQKIRTLLGDLMDFGSRDPDDTDDSVTRRYYYSIKDISIGGQCICYGHASFCRRHDSMRDRLQCQCEDNTTGDNCELCKPLYNQKPWQVRSSNNGGCEQCNCNNKAEKCVYNATVAARSLSLNIDGIYNGGGVCVECQEYTTGINCERCLPGYYRPMGMTQDMRFPCRPCNCLESQSSSADCVQDDSRLSEGLRPGDCLCKEGFSGRTCDSCAVGYYGYPNCRQCRCDVAGSIDPENCDRQCVCKENVVGSRCDVCKDGHFHLDINNPLGCTECFCFGASTVCESVNWGLAKVHDMNGWILSHLEPGGLTLLPRLFNGWLEAKVYLPVQGRNDPRSYSVEDIHYWVAPMSYLGNRLSSYGGHLELTLRYRLDNQMRNKYYLQKPNFVLQGSNMTITADLKRLRENSDYQLQVHLHESSWRHLEDDRRVTRAEMMTLLYKLKRLLIRATYNTAQDTVFLKDVYLDMATPMVMDGSSLKSVEQCRCPEGYAGLSCENCISGWKRVDNQLIRGRCRKCQCHNHADDCDPYTGKCLACKHSTTGDYCERCLPGFYGDARYGYPDDCKPCSCPLVSGNNFFAERCVARPTSDNPDAYECVNCREGYTGVRCQTCAPGFYGNPIVPGGSCRRCNCGGNIDPARPGSCNPNTGVCNLCTNNTEGQHCERCISGYYGSAVNGNCRPCQCSELGSKDQKCDTRTGQCNCQARFTGRKCDHCQRGYGNIERNCERCNCDRIGSESLTCDSVSGQCRCKPGVGGLSCSQCAVGYHDFSRSGCKDCLCYGPGTTNVISCDHITGTCLCKPGVTGTFCDKCRPYHFGLGSDSGCTKCECDRTGSDNSSCNETTGQCPCKPGVGGRKCDSCLPGYYGFSSAGCQVCEPCEKAGHVCNPMTGLCSCPTNTEGPTCQMCITDGWGYDKDGGCKLCNCSIEGSLSQQCDLETGSCECHEGFHGYSCDGCLAGFHSFPKCQECACNHAGSLSDTCPDNAEYCECNKMGQCYCKKNVEGQRCENCRPDTFSLDQENPYGCTECYCFLRAQSCIQAPYVWIKVAVPNLDTHFSLLPDDADFLQQKFGYNVISSEYSYVHPELRSEPVYWQLNMEGMDKDMVQSYNGRLEFYHFFEDHTTNIRNAESKAPLIILIGNGIELHYGYSHLEPSTLQEISVKFHEELWYFKDQIQPVDRRFLMIALQNVTAILVRAVQDGSASSALLDNVYIQRAVPEGPGVNSTRRAIGVEICDCPERFIGVSCQKPGPGYYRVPPLDSDINLSSPETVIGVVKACQCFKHSQLCDPDTGDCEACLHNTVGRNCEQCAEGYFGVATKGTPNDCQPCRCPLPEPSNNFSPTCKGGRNGMMCTACKPAYEGVQCERCAPGFYGNPQILGDTCKPCLCSPDGSINQECEREYGQCPCLPGISGRTCEVCSDETAGVQGGKCVSCYSGCTGILLADLSNWTVPLLNFDPSGVVYPWDDLNNLQTQVKLLKGKLGIMEQAGGARVKNLTSDIDYLDTAALRLINRLDTVGASACKIKDKATTYLEDVTNLEKDVNATHEEIKGILDYIRKLIYSLQGDYQGLDMNAALQAAKDLLAEIQARDFSPQDKAIWEENEAAEMLAEQIEKLKKKNVDTNGTQARLFEMERRLNDLVDQIQIANNTSNDALDKIKQLMKLLNTLNDVQKKIEKVESESFTLLEEAQDLLVEAESTLYISEDQTVALTMFLEQLRGNVDDLRKAIPSLEKGVQKAMNHAEMLQERAKELDDLYELVRNQSENAVMAAKAYESIVNAINKARKSAEQALNDAKVSKKIAGVENMTDEVVRLIQRSKELIMEAEPLLVLAKNLTDPLRNLQDDLEVAQADHEDNQGLLDDLKLDNLPKNLSNRANNVFPVIEEAKENTQATFDILNNINATKQSSKFDGLKDVPDLNDNLTDTLAITKTAEKGVSKLNDLKQKVDERMSANARKAVGISHDLDALRAKIRDARNRVNDMKLSLKADGQCFRTYRSTLKPSATNEIRFAFKPETEIIDALLVLLEQSPEEFLAADIANQKVRFSWNSGSGVGSVLHDQILEPDKWYHVMAKRIGSVGQLKVWPEDGQEELAQKVSASLGAGCSLMNLNKSSIIYLAGSGNSDQIPSEVSSENFKGCMGEIFLDAHRLGVYNFKSDIQDHCGACEEVPQLLIADKVFVFNGRGFARYEVNRYNARRTKIELEFKTFYEDSKIFFVGSESNGDFLSLDLKDGHVTVRFNMGGISTAFGKTNNTYNNNKWIKIIFDRNRQNAALIVDKEKIMLKAPGGNTGLEISGAPMYFGGVPTILDVVKFRGLEKNEFFFGCMQKLTFYTLPPDADSSSFVNVQQSSGCRENGISTVDFRGDGYLTLESENIAFMDDTNDISLTFVTTKADAVILLARDIPGNNYYSISLVDGKLEVRMKGQGTSSVLIKSFETFNDGTMHCVSLIKNSQRLKLIANDKVLGNEEAIDVQFPSTNNSSLYLGGNPARNILGMAATNEKFDGCISDVIVNGNLLSMADATQYKRADVGRCRFTTDTTKPVVVAEENSNEPTTVMTTTTTVAPALLSMADPQSCAKVVKADEEQGAHTVGFSRSFHAEITNVKKREIAKNFIFTFDFRTFYEDGLFGYLTNGDKTFYLGIQLIKGHLEVAYMYEGSHVSLSFDKELNDGKWHLVQLEKASKVLSLTYDGEPKRSNSIANRLEFKPPLNLGGPITADFFKDNGINLVSHSVRGCIRNLKLNQMEISLNDVKVIQDIKTGKCHKDVEPGIYFGGDAWGIYETDFIIEEGINISLEFKTKSTMGILVSVGSDSDSKFGLTLELDKGKVKFGVRNNDGEFRIESDNINKYMFCDNQWHTVQAAIFAGQVSIKVDEGKLLSSSVTGMMEAIETQSPLFIGGYESESGKFKQPASLSQDNFNGCMKKLMINDKFVDWYGLKNDAHLQKDACPTL